MTRPERVAIRSSLRRPSRTSAALAGQAWPAPFIPSDPTVTTNPPLIAQITDASVAFDRLGNLYVLEVQHTASNNAGFLVLSRYNANTGNLIGTPQTVYQWNRTITNQDRAKAILQPVLAVDDTLDPATGTTNSTSAGNVYIAYIGDTPPPTSPPNTYTRTTVELITSTDQGATFNTLNPLVLNAGGNNTPTPIQQNESPRIAISQGRADGTGPAA